MGIRRVEVRPVTLLAGEGRRSRSSSRVRRVVEELHGLSRGEFEKRREGACAFRWHSDEPLDFFSELEGVKPRLFVLGSHRHGSGQGSHSWLHGFATKLFGNNQNWATKEPNPPEFPSREDNPVGPNSLSWLLAKKNFFWENQL